jgi:hypothetical protein
MSRRAAAALVSIGLLGIAAPAAGADGVPVGGSSWEGVAAGPYRYVALPAGRGTVVARIWVAGGRPQFSRYFHRQLSVPAVALDGAGGGLSHDGRTFVLTPPRTSYPQRASTLYFLSPRTLQVRKTIHLKGDFSFDALSPDGATTYLIQLDSRNPAHYAVRALDSATGRLAPKSVVDAREPGEEMRGYPYTRVTSADGRFAYTLYNGGDKPFVHALDTVARSAACIDLPSLSQNSSSYKLRLDGRRLTVLADNVPVSYVDTRTRAVSNAGAPPTRPHKEPGGGSSVPWGLIAGATAAALAAAAALVAVRRPRASAGR